MLTGVGKANTWGMEEGSGGGERLRPKCKDTYV